MRLNQEYLHNIIIKGSEYSYWLYGDLIHHRWEDLLNFVHGQFEFEIWPLECFTIQTPWMVLDNLGVEITPFANMYEVSYSSFGEVESAEFDLEELKQFLISRKNEL